MSDVRRGLAELGPYGVIFVVTAWFAKAAYVVVGNQRYFVLFDDAMISMTYARNLARGHGLVWVVGERPVEGITNLAWTFWMAFLHLLAPDRLVGLLVILSSGALLAVLVAVCRQIAQLLAPADPVARMVTGWAVALCYPVVYWALRGMEVGLTAVVLALAVLLAIRIHRASRRKDVLLLTVIASVGLLTRLDLAAPLAIITGWLMVSASVRRRVWIATVVGGSLAVVIASETVFRLWYFGSALPNTYYLKVSGISIVDRVERGALAMLVATILGLLWPALAAAAGLRIRSGSRGAYAMICCVVATCAIYSVAVGGDAWEAFGIANRYVAQALPLLLTVAVVALCSLHVSLRVVTVGLLTATAMSSALEGLRGARLNDLWIEFPTDRHLPIALLVAAGALVIYVYASHAEPDKLPLLATALMMACMSGVPLARQILDGPYYAASDRYEVRVGLALRSQLPPRTTIAVLAAGTMPYFADLPAEDLLGKSDSRIAHSRPHEPFRPGHNKFDYQYSIAELRPDVVVQFAAPLTSSELRRWGYRKVMLQIGEGIYVRDGVEAVAHGSGGNVSAHYAQR